MTQQQQLYGWYSRTQASEIHKQLTISPIFKDSISKPIKVWDTPTGKHVDLTMVTQGLNHDSNYDDLIYLGVVTEFVYTKYFNG